MSEHFADITSIDTRRPHPVEPLEDETETLFRQRDEAIAESLILRRRVQQLAAECARLRSKLIENGIQP